ncbi:hypothetical protein [Lactiplantibacillus modestisalitolerans]|uniref:Uncharacterized protein n=1 Tax=Lactiplantibacillus modestisalitolerans TaxID=1457219 RepID=A0ABV5WW34_9LACO|nr:hypothetical protein [Lactiplantibacillus modestisalitolerans]
MQRNVQTFIEAIQNEDYQTASVDGDYAKLSAQVPAWLEALLAIVRQDQLGTVTLAVKHEPAVSFRLETSLINLPLANLTEIGKVTDAEATMPVTINMIAESEALPSNLRIDELGQVADVVADPENATKRLTTWLTTQVDRLAEIAAADA